MTSGIILHEDHAPVSSDVRYGNWSQYKILIAGGVQVANDMHNLRFSVEGNSTPYHNGPTAKLTSLSDTVVAESLPTSAIDPCAAVRSSQIEFGFVGEENPFPICPCVPQMASSPLQTQLAVSVSKDCPNVRSSCSQAHAS